MSVWSFLLYGVSMSFTASRRQSCHLSRNASAAGFPSGQSEFLRPGSLLWPHPPRRPCLYSNSIITSLHLQTALLQLLLFGLQHFLFDQYLPIHLLTAMSKCWHKLLVVHTMSKLNRYLLTGIVSNQPWTGDGLCDSLLEIIRQEGEWIPGV